ncbi:IS66 family transposase [Acanthopleuribacter pedis]
MFKDHTLDYILSDPKLGRPVFRGLEKEILQLRKALAKARGYDGETGYLEGIEEELIEKQAEVERLKKKLYGRSSDKAKGGDSEGGDPDSKSSGAGKRKKPADSGRGQVGQDLPLAEEEYRLEDQPKCGCGLESPLKKVKQAEITHVVDYVPAKFINRKIIRWKYRAKKCGCRVTAPGPTTLVDGGQYGVNLAVELVVRKFQDQLPWERQVKALQRDGLRMAGSTMWNQTRHVANLLEDVYEALRRDIELGFHRHADETRWRVLEGVENQQQFAWLFRNENHAYFTIEDTRSGKVPLRVMGDAAGALVADDYGGYNALVAKNELLRIQCWSHTRRYFTDIQHLEPDIKTYLDLVAKLYRKDREFKAGPVQTPAHRRALCGPVIEEIDAWRKRQRCLPKSPMGKALGYMNDNWAGLTAFLDDPDLPLDNNPAERALRQLVLGRKNFMFNRSVEGARVTAILYSICVSCTLCGVDPKKYLSETIMRIRNGRGFQLPYAFANEHETFNLI